MRNSGMIIRMLRMILCIVASMLCLAPSAWINVSVRTQMDGNLAIAAACVASVIIAAICVIAAEIAWRDRRYARLFWLAPVFVILLAFNLSNAIALSGANRTVFTEPRRTAMKDREDFKGRLSALISERSRYRDASASMSPGMIQGQIEAHRLTNQRVWNRTGRCQNVTRDDSGAFCAELASLKGKLAAAAKAEQLDAKIAALNAKLAETPRYEQVEHPHIEAMTNVYATFFPLTERTREQVRVASDLLFGVTIEIVAAFGPVLAFLLLWPGTQDPAKPKREPKAEPKAGSDEEVVALFLNDCTLARQDAKVLAMNLYNAFRAWCADMELEPISQNSFGRHIGKSYTRKKIDGRSAYAGLTLSKPVRLVSSTESG